MSKKTKNQTLSANYLEYVPIHNPKVQYKVSDDKKVTLYQENKGLFNFLGSLG